MCIDFGYACKVTVNFQTIRAKRQPLWLLLDEIKLDIVLVGYTWLYSSIFEKESAHLDKTSWKEKTGNKTLEVVLQPLPMKIPSEMT